MRVPGSSTVASPRPATRGRFATAGALSLLGALLAAAPLAAQQPGDETSIAIPGTGVSLRLVYVPAGAFAMGSAEDEPGRDDDEGPRHAVGVSGFWMTATEITHDQFTPFRDRRRDTDVAAGGTPFDVDAYTRPSPPYEDPSHGMERGARPATGMTRLSALHYARWLSEKTGRFFVLPTEAQWEWACRAGTGPDVRVTAAEGDGGDAAGGPVGSFAGGVPEDLDAIAWFEDNSAGTYHEVGGKSPNAWGLHDMSGNVAEWVIDEYVADAYSEPYPATDPVNGRPGMGRGVVRGGAFDDPPERLRCSERYPEATVWKARDPQMPKSRWWNTDSPHVGFRLVSPADERSMEEIRAFWTELLGG